MKNEILLINLNWCFVLYNLPTRKKNLKAKNRRTFLFLYSFYKYTVNIKF